VSDPLVCLSGDDLRIIARPPDSRTDLSATPGLGEFLTSETPGDSLKHTDIEGRTMHPPATRLNPRLHATAMLCLLVAAGACSNGSDSAGPATVGAIEVRVSTEGSALDADGYTLVIDGFPNAVITPQTTRTLDGLTPGAHTVALAGMADNCTIYALHPLVVTVRVGATTVAAIVVTCQGQVGIIRTVTFTTGTNQDPNGYAFAIDDGPRTAVGSNGTVDTRLVPVGNHDVALSGLAPNCQALTPTPQFVRVEHNTTTEARFAVTCAPAVPTSIAYVSGFDLQVVDWDGANSHPVLSSVSPQDPAWSPDRAWIAFSGENQGLIALVRPDGSDLHWLPSTMRDASPSFSPDGTKLVFVEGNCGQLALMNVDGSARTQLLADARCQSSPDWAPDGTAIVFEMAGRIYRINTDGTSLTALGDYGSDPSWSPDGTKIVLARNGRIHTMNANGSGGVDIGTGQSPAWSPDGTSIVFVGATGSHLFIMNADGSAVQPLTTANSFDRLPAWSP